MVFIAAGEKARREQRVSLEEEDQDEWKLYRSCGSEFLGLSRLVLTVSSLFCKGLGSPCYIFQLCSYTMKAATVSSVAQLCPTLCDPMNCSTPGLPVHHQLPESTQTHVHCVGDPIQPSHPLLSPSPPAFNLSQHQGLFKWVSSVHQVAKVLEFQLQHQSFQWTPRTDLL